MSAILDRAKAIQAKTATETQIWIRLDLLEGLIREIEVLQLEVLRLAANDPRTGLGAALVPKDIGSVVDLASKRKGPTPKEPEEQK